MADNNAPWYKQSVFWWLMAGPIVVVIAGFFTFGLAKTHANDLVSDDYYKDGKHINLQLERDTEAVKRHISAQVLFNDDGTAAKVFASGDFNRADKIQLSLLHPTRKDGDQIITLQEASAPASGDKTEYSATFNRLPATNHWYVRVEDMAGNWRVEGKWLPSQGGAVDLQPKDVSALQ